MNLAQKILLFFTGAFLIFGSILILLFPGFALLPLVIFDMIVIVGARLIYSALKSKEVTKLLGQKKLSNPQNKTIYSSKAVDVANQNRILYIVECMRPFELFPDKLVIEEESLTVIRKLFFSTSVSETILFKDLFSVVLNSGPFFASLTLTRKTSIESAGQQIEIKYLNKHQALRAKEIIDGLLLETAKSVTISKKLPTNERRQLLQKAGTNTQLEKEI